FVLRVVRLLVLPLFPYTTLFRSKLRLEYPIVLYFCIDFICCISEPERTLTKMRPDDRTEIAQPEGHLRMFFAERGEPFFRFRFGVGMDDDGSDRLSFVPFHLRFKNVLHFLHRLFLRPDLLIRYNLCI